jgi:hypothetical protein
LRRCALFADADTAYKKVMKSTLTKELQDLDKERDNLFRGLVEANRAALRHFDEEVRKRDLKTARQLKQKLLDFGVTYGSIATFDKFFRCSHINQINHSSDK